ncbi:hypothetical protein JCM16161A_10900 [Vulcanisaeta sp. JCM 16161]
MGVTRDRHVVLLDEIDNRHAAIAYMVLKALGFNHVSILNGGKVSWLIHKGPLCTCNGHVSKGNPNVMDLFNVTANLKDYFADFEQVYELISKHKVGVDTILIDVRSPCEYIGGDVDIWGHIPGAINMPWNLFLEPRTNRFRDRDEIRKIINKYGLSPDDD